MTVSFTGHRPDKIAGYSSARGAVEVAIRKAVAEEIERAVERGAECFVCGMAPGFDLWAADEVLRLRAEGRIGVDVQLRCAVPYPNFEHSFGKEYRSLYESVMEGADETLYLSHGYHHGCYARRNDYLVECADLVVAYYEGGEGGTRYTLRRAMREGVPIVNLAQRGLFE